MRLRREGVRRAGRRAPGVVVAVVLVLLMMLAGGGAAMAVSYPDVPADHTFADPIDALTDQGIIGGFEDGTFRPGYPVERAQYAKIIVGAVGAHTPSAEYPNATGDPAFPDTTAADTTLCDFVNEAAWQGLVQGYENGNFGPFNSITRVQLALMVVRAVGDALTPGTVGDLPFTDLDGVSTEGKQAIATAYANGIISGKSATAFDPLGTATRGQAAKMTWNLVHQLQVEKPSVPEHNPKVDHSGFITDYDGPETCEGSHPGSMDEVAMSLHFTMDEEEVPGLQGMAGRY